MTFPSSWSKRTLASVAITLAPALLGATPAWSDEGRDQALVGLRHGGPLSRLSFYGGIGLASVRGRDTLPPSRGRLAFDLGTLYQLNGPFRIGVAFNHFRFVQEAAGVEFPREVNDVTGFVRFDVTDQHVLPYAEFGGGIYFTEGGVRSDLLRGSLGLEIPIGRNMLRLEGRYTSFANGVYLDADEEGRQSSLGVVFGIRFPLARGGATAPPSRDDFIKQLRETTKYVATAAERQELEAIQDVQALLDYIDAFWDRRDPYPEIEGNVARERHMRRVHIAESRFPEAGRPGWATERGRTLIVYGEPDEVLWEYRYPRSFGRDPDTAGIAADTGSSTSLELWIYYQALPATDGTQSFFLFEEDAVSRYAEIWSNVSGEYGFGQPLPPLPATLAQSIQAGTTSLGP